jgi:hypothetical protein
MYKQILHMLCLSVLVIVKDTRDMTPSFQVDII